MSVNSTASSIPNKGGASSARQVTGAKRAVSSETKLSMEEVAKKLSLWHTYTFRPILTHDDLEPILASAGFSPLPVDSSSDSTPSAGTKGGASGTAWKEYEYCKRGGKGGVGYGGRDEMVIGGGWRPMPRLPCGRLDGLHLMAYKAFFISLEFYLGPHLVPNLFHVRAMPLSRAHDMQEKTYRPMRDCGIDEEGIFVYREGSLDRITKVICSFSNNYYSIASDPIYTASNNTNNLSSGETETNNWRELSKNGASEQCISLVPLKDLFPSNNRDLITFS